MKITVSKKNAPLTTITVINMLIVAITISFLSVATFMGTLTTDKVHFLTLTIIGLLLIKIDIRINDVKKTIQQNPYQEAIVIPNRKQEEQENIDR